MTAQPDTQTPMGRARYVRRERYAWPGGYALALITDDGDALCPACVTSEYPKIAAAVRRDDRRGGWYPAAIACEANEDGPLDCDRAPRLWG